MTYRVLVCGGRNYGCALSEIRRAWQVLDALHAHVRARGQVLVLVHGAAPGADMVAQLWAEQRGVETVQFPCDWAHESGTDRNKRMVAFGAEMCVAFPGGAGTAHTVRLCRRVGMPVSTVDAWAA